MHGKRKNIQHSGHNSYRFQWCSGALERLPFLVRAEEPVALVPLIAIARTLPIISVRKQMAREVDPEVMKTTYIINIQKPFKWYQPFTTTVQHAQPKPCCQLMGWHQCGKKSVNVNFAGSKARPVVSAWAKGRPPKRT